MDELAHPAAGCICPMLLFGSFGTIPIPSNATPAEQAAVAALVTGILAAKAADPAADARAAVDAAVAALYGVALPAAT